MISPVTCLISNHCPHVNSNLALHTVSSRSTMSSFVATTARLPSGQLKACSFTVLHQINLDPWSPLPDGSPLIFTLIGAKVVAYSAARMWR